MRFEISVQIKQSPTISVYPIEASSILKALETIHRQLQKKDKLQPDEYVIRAAEHIYPASVGGQEMIRDGYPVSGRNPDLNIPNNGSK